MKTSIVVLAAAVLFAVPALAQQCPNRGTCSAGTCAQNSGRVACDVKNCSAANCVSGNAKFCQREYRVCVQKRRNPAWPCEGVLTQCMSSGCWKTPDRRYCKDGTSVRGNWNAGNVLKSN
jgi:hypothetical protein